MTVPYEATDRSCLVCGEPVEDYTGHWHASEITCCEECYDDNVDDLRHRADVVHRVPRKEGADG